MAILVLTNTIYTYILICIFHTSLKKYLVLSIESHSAECIDPKNSINNFIILDKIENPKTYSTPAVRNLNHQDEIKNLREEIIHLRHEVLDSKQKLKCLNESFDLFKNEQMQICASIKVTVDEILKKIYHLVIPDNVGVKDSSCHIEEEDDIEWSFPIKEMSDIKSFDNKLLKNKELKSKIVCNNKNYQY